MSKIFKQTLRDQHLILSLGLGLFVLLAGGGSLTSALLMTLALFLNLWLTTSILFFIKRWLSQETKFIVILIVMASVGTLVQMLAVAFLPGWVKGLEVYLPLLAISGLILARVETTVQTGTLRDVWMDTLGSTLSFAMLVIPIGLLADGLGFGVIQLATFAVGTPQPMLFQFTILPFESTIPFFTGSYGAIGMLILAALWLAFIQRLRGGQA
jgi:Na+-translocating ferredoxin:NAD+ oxidoreductase RnfE subunit